MSRANPLGQMMRYQIPSTMTLVAGLLILNPVGRLFAAEAGAEWQQLLAASKKERKVVIGAPPGSDFRNDPAAYW